jgi:hypothetical protein
MYSKEITFSNWVATSSAIFETNGIGSYLDEE